MNSKAGLLLCFMLFSTSLFAMSAEEKLFLKVFGAQQPTLSEELSIPVALDGEHIGLAKIVIKSHNGQQSILANKTIFIELLQTVLKEENYQEYVSQVQKLDGQRVEIEQVVCCGIEYFYNEHSMSIDIKTLPEARKKTVRYLRDYGDLIPDSLAYKPASFSGALSFYFNQPLSNHSENKNLNLDPYNFQLSSFFNYQGVILESSFNYLSKGSLVDFIIEEEETTEVEATKDELLRDYTTLSKVFANENILLSIGDIKSEISAYTSGPKLLGFSLQKRKDKYNFNKRESLRIGESTIFLENDALVEIYVNGVKRNVIRLNAGTHDLIDFSLDAGVNEIEFRITDIYGKKSVIKYDDFFYGEVLKSGEVEYGLSFGQVSRKVNSNIEYIDDLYFLSGSYSRGFEPFTYNFSLQHSNEDYFALGSKFIVPSTFGIIEVSRNLTSFKHNDQKARDEFKYKYANKRFLLTYKISNQDEGYAIFSENTNPSSKSKSEILSGSYTFKRGDKLLLSFYQARSDASSYVQDELGYLHRLSKELELELKLSNKNYSYGGEDNKSAFISLRWSPFSKPYRAELSRLKDKTSTTQTLVVRGDLDDDEINSYSYDLSLSQTNEHYSSSLMFEKSALKYKVTADLEFDQHSSFTQKKGALKFETGLAFVNEHASFTRPQRDSFILVDNQNQDKKIPPISLNGFHTNAKRSVHAFPPFTMRNLFVDELDLPLNVELLQSEYGIISSYKAGIYIPIDFKKSVIMKIYLKDKNNKALAYKPVKILHNRTGDVYESFTNKKGRLIFSDALMKEQYEIVADQYRYVLNVNESKKRVMTIHALHPKELNE